MVVWTYLIFALCVSVCYAVLPKEEKCPQRIIILRHLNGSVKSIGYPNSYSRNQLCIYHIVVPRGYKIRAEFDELRLGKPERLSSNCLKSDHVILSTRVLHLQDVRKISKKNQILFCGIHQPTRPIITRGNKLWIRFHADRRKRKGEVGFKLSYSALDKNECEQKKRPCQQICINTQGSYTCACHKGYRLNKDRKTCSIVKVVKFLQNEYHALIKQDDVKLNKILLRVTAVVETQLGHALNVTPAYVIREENEYVHVDEQTGDISFNSRPSTTKTAVQFIVEASTPHGSPGHTLVKIAIKVKNKLDKHFTILLQQGVQVNQEIFNLKPHYSRGHTVSIFSMNDQHYFGVKANSGKIYIKSQLPESVNASLMWKTRFSVRVKVLDELGMYSYGVITINIALLPVFPGESFITPDILKQVADELDKDLKISRKRVPRNDAKVSFQTVGLHRLLRRASLQAQKISKAKSYFDEVMKRVQEKIQDLYTQGDNDGTPVIIHLGTGHIISSLSLEKVVNASKCKEVLKSPDCTSFMFGSNYQPFDGACNNIKNPLWGAAPMAFKRLLPPLYFDADGLSDPIGFPNLPEAPILPSAHKVSKTFFKAHKMQWTSKKNAFSHMLMQWGQFLDHDITMTAESEGGHYCVFPRCDDRAADYRLPCFPMMYPGHNQGCSMFIRSAAVCQTKNDNIEARQQMNTITSFIDASMVYGSSTESALKLRRNDGSGLMKTTRHAYLPVLEETVTPPLSFCKNFGGCFDAGDVRVNEQVALTSMHTLWMREHNKIAKKLKIINKNWSGERIYLETRKIVAAQIQHITYKEYLPKILGKDSLPKYTGYNQDIDPTISNVFATAAFRFGHSLVQPSFSRLNANFDKIDEDLPLVKAFFNNTLLLLHGIEPFLYGMVGNATSDVDRNMAHGLVRGLFQRPGAAAGFDLSALNIQRGRDHGLPGYGRWREFCNFRRAYSFNDLADVIKSNETRSILKQLYEDQVEYTDVFVAGLAEDHVKDAIVGPLFHCILKDQFQRLRDGDRFYYENDFLFTKSQLTEIRKTSLASVMCHNMKGIVSIQPDVFKLAKDGETRRKVCNDIGEINLDAWRESDPENNQQWTGWYETIRLATGTWSLQQEMCANKSIIDIECKSMDGKSYTEMDENTQCAIPIGVYCRNERLSDKSCSDYKMRMLCLDTLSVVNHHEAAIETGFPKLPNPSPVRCKSANQNDYAMVIPTLDEAVINDPYHTTAQQEYLHVGRNSQYKKRILLKFDLRRIKRTDSVHSAGLQVFYVGQSRSTFSSRSTRPSKLSAYLITSTNWNSTNVTSRVPWMEDYLSVGKDTDPKALDQIEIIPEKSGWLYLNMYRAVRQWRLSTDLRRDNFGLMLMLIDDEKTTAGISRIASSSHENLTIRPNLIICLSSGAW